LLQTNVGTGSQQVRCQPDIYVLLDYICQSELHVFPLKSKQTEVLAES